MVQERPDRFAGFTMQTKRSKGFLCGFKVADKLFDGGIVARFLFTPSVRAHSKEDREGYNREDEYSIEQRARKCPLGKILPGTEHQPPLTFPEQVEYADGMGP